jgi:hypothetical protein
LDWTQMASACHGVALAVWALRSSSSHANE